MGQLFVMEDSITQEELLRQLSQKLGSNGKNKRDRIYGYKNGSYRKKKSGRILGKKLQKNFNSFDVSELPSLKSDSEVQEMSLSTSSQTCTSSSPQSMSSATALQCLNETQKKIQCNSTEMPSSSYSNNSTVSHKTSRKRKKGTSINVGGTSESLLKRKLKTPCEILKAELKKTMTNGRRMKSTSNDSVKAINGRVDYNNFNEMSSFPEKSCGDSLGLFESTSKQIGFDQSSTHQISEEDTKYYLDVDIETSGVNISENGFSKIKKTYNCNLPQTSSNCSVRNIDSVKQKSVINSAIISVCDSKEAVVNVICDHNGYSDGHLDSSLGVAPESSRTADLELTLQDKDSSFCLGRIFTSECSSTADLGESKLESGKAICCTDTSSKLPTIINIPDSLYVALDCEMVGVGPKGKHSVLARCSIVDYNGKLVYDKYIRPTETITDYRTPWSGIRPVHMKTAVPIQQALKDIKECLAHKVIIGHAVYHDFKVLGVLPDHHFVRDTTQCQQLVDMAGLHGKGNGLKKLSEALLDRKIQVGSSGHCSIEDARATLDLFKLVRSSWEPVLYSKWSKKNADIASKIATFVETSIRHQDLNSTEDFLNDKFWPSHILE